MKVKARVELMLVLSVEQNLCLFMSGLYITAELFLSKLCYKFLLLLGFSPYFSRIVSISYVEFRNIPGWFVSALRYLLLSPL